MHVMKPNDKVGVKTSLYMEYIMAKRLELLMKLEHDSGRYVKRNRIIRDAIREYLWNRGVLTDEEYEQLGGEGL